jgi:hypothetical protein
MNSQLHRRQFMKRTAAAAGAAAAGLYLPTIARAADRQWGNLTGRLVYDGTPPERAKLKVDKDVEFCGKFDIRDESLMVGPDGGLANVYFYVRTRDAAVCPELEATVEKQVVLDNRNAIFIPHCMKIWCAKQELRIVNSDPIAQNVAFQPLGDVPANIVMAAIEGGKPTEATHRFARKQNVPVPIACNYHPWESAYILPREDPYVGITAPDGTFTIPKLPVGELEFQVWHERIGYLNTPQWPRGRFTIAVKPDGTDLGTVKVAPKSLVKE